jgi:hypothetical protein
LTIKKKLLIKSRNSSNCIKVHDYHNIF